MLEQMGEQVERGLVQGGGMPVPHSAPADVVDEGESFVVTVDLPGYATADVDLTFADGTLRLEATRDLEREDVEEDGRYVRRERHASSVSRRIPLPGDVDEEGISASLADGVLTVTVPKAEGGDEGHRIEVE